MAHILSRVPMLISIKPNEERNTEPNSDNQVQVSFHLGVT